MKEKIYLITGATGFVGSHVVQQLEKDGHKVIALARDEQKALRALAGTHATIMYGDVLNKGTLNNMFELVPAGYEPVFIHTASVVYLESNHKQLKKMRDVNINGTANVIAVCRAHNCRLVYVSSVHAITEQPNRGLITEITNFDPKAVVGHYAKTKAAASRLVMEAAADGLDATIVHPSGIIGPNDPSYTHMTQMVHEFIDGHIPAATNGGYDFVDVRDVAAGIIAAANRGIKGECYLLSNQYISVADLYRTLNEVGAQKHVRLSFPRAAAYAALPFTAISSTLTHKRPLFSAYSLYTLGSNSNFSHEKATGTLGYNPRSIKESLHDMFDEYMGGKK